MDKDNSNADEKSEKLLGYLPTYAGCIVCGEKAVNPSSLNLRFEVIPEGVRTIFTAQKEQEGYPGIVHGGIITAVLDETIGWSVAVARHKYFVTAELTVRFLRPLSVGKQVLVFGYPLVHKARYSEAEGEMVDKTGIRYAWARGKFYLLSEEKNREVDAYLTYRNGDLHLISSL